MFSWRVLQVGYRHHSRMTERRQVLPLQFRCADALQRTLIYIVLT